MHSILPQPDQTAWFYDAAGPHFSQWRNELLTLPLLLQPCNHARTMDQLPPLTQANISPSPSESSLISEDGSPSPQHLNVVCNVPIVVPKPRPYRSLANLQFDLPSEDQDLSHPPYCSSRSAAKRKRTDDDDADDGFSPTPPSADRGSKRRRALLDSSLSLPTPTVHPSLSRSLHGSHPVTRHTQTGTSGQFRHRQPQGRPR